MHAVIHCLSAIVIIAAIAFAASAANERAALRRQVHGLRETQEEVDGRHAVELDALRGELRARAQRINEDVDRTKQLIEEKQAAVKAMRLEQLKVKGYEKREQQLDEILKICVIRADWKDVKALADRGEFTKEERDADGAIGLQHRSGLWVTTYPPEGADTRGLVKAKTTAR